MTSPFRSALPFAEFRRLRVHEVLRDYPEVLEVLRGKEIDPRETGTQTLDEVRILSPEDLRDLARAVAWRGGP